MSWWQQVPFFSKRFRTVTFDQRGFADSFNPPEAPCAEAFADDLLGLLNHLQIERAFMVGQSMGGRSVLNFAKRFPERTRAIVMAATLGNIRTDDLDRMRRTLRQTLPKNRLAIAMAPRVYTERPQLAYLYRLIQSRNPLRPERFLWQDNRNGTRAEELARMTLPALFVVGEEDVIAPPLVVAEAARLLPNSRLVTVPEAGHSVYFEQPEGFNAHLLRFFQENGGGS